MFIDPSCVRFCAGGFLSNVIVMAMDGYVRLWEGKGRDGMAWNLDYLLTYSYFYISI